MIIFIYQGLLVSSLKGGSCEADTPYLMVYFVTNYITATKRKSRNESRRVLFIIQFLKLNSEYDVFFALTKKVFSKIEEKKIFFLASLLIYKIEGRAVENIGISHWFLRNQLIGWFRRNFRNIGNKTITKKTILRVRTFTALGLTKKSTFKVKKLLRKLPAKQAGKIKILKATFDFFFKNEKSCTDIKFREESTTLYIKRTLYSWVKKILKKKSK